MISYNRNVSHEGTRSFARGSSSSDEAARQFIAFSQVYLDEAARQFIAFSQVYLDEAAR